MQLTFRVVSVDYGREIRLFVNRSDTVENICNALASDESWFRKHLRTENIEAGCLHLYYEGKELDRKLTAEQHDLYFIHRRSSLV